MWEKEKLLFTSNFSFSRCVFKRLALQTRKNQGLFGKGLNLLVNKEFLISFSDDLNDGDDEDLFFAAQLIETPSSDLCVKF